MSDTLGQFGLTLVYALRALGVRTVDPPLAPIRRDPPAAGVIVADRLAPDPAAVVVIAGLRVGDPDALGVSAAASLACHPDSIGIVPAGRGARDPAARAIIVARRGGGDPTAVLRVIAVSRGRDPEAALVVVARRRDVVDGLHPAAVAVVVPAGRALDPATVAVEMAGRVVAGDRIGVPGAFAVVEAIGPRAVRLASTEKEDAALSLTVAVVAASNGPLLLLDEGLAVMVASQSFCRAFALDPTTVVGSSVFQLGRGEWNVPQLRSLLTSTAAGNPPPEAYEFELGREGVEPRCLSVHAQRLAYLDLEEVRLLVGVTDITAARADAKARETLSRENSVLLQEVRHRIANSLQIIASVLLQGARNAQSDEARGQLQNAHHRVMSVAALERQLSASIGDKGAIGAYLSKLCGSIADSMIQEPDRIGLEVVADDAVVPANVLVSLGLITTELVINALKYAFPGGRAGKIRVAYEACGGSWTLRVTDDGAGMGGRAAPVVAGLGTGIVDALAKQLGATVAVADAVPGVSVSISHRANVGQPFART